MSVFLSSSLKITSPCLSALISNGIFPSLKSFAERTLSRSSASSDAMARR